MIIYIQHNHRNKREASALVRIWTAHTSILRAQYSFVSAMIHTLFFLKDFFF